MRIRLKPIGWPLAVALASAGMLATPTAAPAEAGATGGSIVQVATNRGKLITLAKPMSDIFVANPEIADVQVRSPTQLYVFGKKGGETTISATSKSGAVVYAATVRVGNNFDSLGQMLALAMPDAQVTATTMNGVVLLTGTVAGPDDASEAERLVAAFVGDETKVISRLRTATPLQVNLQVRIAEVSRSWVKNIGVNLTTRDNSGGFLFGVGQGRQGTITTVPVVPTAPAGSVDANGLTPGSTLFKFPANGLNGTTLGLAGRMLGVDVLSAIDLGETLGQVSTLANPNLTALSGETATFLAGGEIPIPISQGLGAVSVEYKQYGVSLAYTPTVLSNGRISLRVRPEVSQLTSEGSVQLNGTTIPALTTRRAETTLELGSGESMVIGGLLQNTHNNSIDKAPGLGDLPVLGALFRSNGFRRSETELVIVVTPYLVKPVNANDIVLPTDGYKAPTDLERVFLGKLSSGTTGGERPKPVIQAGPPAAPAIGAAAPAGMPSDPAPLPKRREEADRKAAKSNDKKGASPAPGFSVN
jgi:pilus assembly protein CpaC